MISRIKPIDRNANAAKDKQVSRSGLQSRQNGPSKDRQTTTRDKSSTHQRRQETWDTLTGWAKEDPDDGNRDGPSDLEQWVKKRQQLQQKFETSFTSRKYPDLSVQYLFKPGTRCESTNNHENFPRNSLHERFYNEPETGKDPTFKQYNPKAVDTDLDTKLLEYIENIKDRGSAEPRPVPPPSERYKRLLCVIGGTADPEILKEKPISPLSSADPNLNKVSIQFDVTKSKSKNGRNSAKQKGDSNESDTIPVYKNDTLSRAKRIIVLAESRPQTVLSEKQDNVKPPEIHIHVPSIYGDNDENETTPVAEKLSNYRKRNGEDTIDDSSNTLHDNIKTLSKLSNQEMEKINAKSQHVLDLNASKSQTSPRGKIIKSAPSMTNLQIQNMARQSLKRGGNMNPAKATEKKEPPPQPKLTYTHSSGSSTVKLAESRRGSATQSIASNDTSLSKYMVDQLDSESLCSNVISDITEQQIDPSQAWKKYPNGFRNPYTAIDTYYSMPSGSPVVQPTAQRRGSSSESNGNQYESTTKSIPLTMKRVSLQDYNDTTSSQYTYNQSRRSSTNPQNIGASRRQSDSVKLPPAPHGSPKLTSNSSGENSVESAGQLDEHGETIISIADLIAANTYNKTSTSSPRQSTNSAKQVTFDPNANDNDGNSKRKMTAQSQLLKHENDLLKLREGIDVDWVKEAHNPHLGPPGFRPPAQKSASQRVTGPGQIQVYAYGAAKDGVDQRQPRWASSTKLTSDFNRGAISSAPAKLNGNVFDQKMFKKRRALSGLYTDLVYGMDAKSNTSADHLYRFARRNLHQKPLHDAGSRRTVTYMNGQGLDSGLKFAHHKFRQKQRLKRGQNDFLAG